MVLIAPVFRSTVSGPADHIASQWPRSDPLPFLYSAMPLSQPASSSRHSNSGSNCTFNNAASASIVQSVVIKRLQTGSCGRQGGGSVGPDFLECFQAAYSRS